ISALIFYPYRRTSRMNLTRRSRKQRGADGSSARTLRTGTRKGGIHAPLPPMDAALVEKIPEGEGWQYEPKWDGFRCLAFRDGRKVELQSKSGQPLGRYFPELVGTFLALGSEHFILDGEIAVPMQGRFSFDDLLQRIHPANSRVER